MSISRFCLVIGFSFIAIISWAQVPSEIKIERTSENVGESRLDCASQNAGDVAMMSFNGQSNTYDLTDTTFLCFWDQMTINVSNVDLTGDPDPSTPAGVGYAFYHSPPTIGTGTIDDIILDPSILNNPPPVNGIYVFVDELDGTATFQNGYNIGGTTTIQDFFNAGGPVLIWFAPITFDDEFMSTALYEDPGCVNVRLDQAFPVVYLNPIEQSNFQITDPNTCSGSFTLTGGLAEYDGSDYNIFIQKLDDPTVQATIVNQNISHGDQVQFNIPEPGAYQFFINDGKSCGLNFIENLGCGGITLSADCVDGFNGDNVCIDITVEDFEDMIGGQFTLNFDASVLEFDQITDFALPGQNALTFNTMFANLGYISMLWTNPDLLNGESLADGAVLFTICFNVIGIPGEDSPIVFANSPTSIDFYHESGAEVPVLTEDCIVNVVPNGFEVHWQGCGSPDDTNPSGLMEIFVSGGIGPYTVEWEKGASSDSQILADDGSVVFTPLMSGNYTVTVTDNTGSVVQISVSLPIIGGPQIDIVNVNDPSCPGENNGSIEIGFTDVLIPWTISWSNGYFNTTTISNLSEGVYQVTLTDKNGCTDQELFSLNADPLIVTIDKTPASCSGMFDGQAFIDISGGQPINGDQYELKINNVQLPAQTTPIPLIGIEGGTTHYLTIKDAAGCVKLDSFYMPALKTISADNIVIDDISCFGLTDGGISLSAVTSGAPASSPYLFIWKDGNNVPIPSASGPDFSSISNQEPGFYSIEITDLDGCKFDTTLAIMEPEPISVELVDMIGESCQVGNDGSITVQGIGGTVASSSDYNYDWSNSDSGATINGLSQGLYTVTVTDDNLCENTMDVNLGAADGPQIVSFMVDSISCPGLMDGSISIVVSAGNSPIDVISWSNSVTNETSITNLGPDSYTVTIIDEDNCQVEQTFELFDPMGLTLEDIEVNSPTCPELSNGSIILTMSGGTQPYSYNWSDPSNPNGPVLPGISSGNFSVTITDAENCATLVIDTIVEAPDAILVDFDNITGTSCFNTLDGAASASASGGTDPSQNFSYEWSSGELGNLAVQLGGNSQYVIVNDNFCFDTFYVIIPSPPEINFDILEIQDASCYLAQDASITISPNGGTGPNYSVDWENANVGNILDNVGAGQYNFSITDMQLCQLDTFITLSEPDSLVAYIDSTNTFNVTCNGESDGLITVDWIGGNPGMMNFSWSSNISNSNTADDLPAGNYSVTLTDVNGCTDVANYLLTEPTAIFAQVPDPENPDCFGQTTNYTITDVVGGTGSNYSFSIGNGSLNPIGTLVPLSAGTYTVNIYDEAGCFVSSTIEVVQPEPMEAEITVAGSNSSTEIQLGDSLNLLVNYNSEAPIASITWDPPFNLNCIGNGPFPCEFVSVSPLDDQLYTVTLINENGCDVTASILIDVDLNRNVFIPNLFSPNGDGINDKFQVFTGKGVAQINSMYVFDRWGAKIYENRNIAPNPSGTPGWDGRIRGQKAQPGVYVYAIEVSFLDGAELLYKGDITLLR